MANKMPTVKAARGWKGKWVYVPFTTMGSIDEILRSQNGAEAPTKDEIQKFVLDAVHRATVKAFDDMYGR